MQARRSAPLTSICIPTYNGAHYLGEAIESALAQTTSDWELLIVDDGSTDDTLELVDRFAESDRRIRAVRNERNVGLAGNWNRCLELARGDWVKFLFQDDLLEPSCLEELLKRAESDHSLFVACYRDFLFDPDTDDQLREYYLQHRGLVADWLAARTFTPEAFAALVSTLPPRNPIGEPTCTLLHSSLVSEVGGFDPGFIHLCDAEYWVRAGLRYGVSVVPRPLAKFRVHPASATANNLTSRQFAAQSLDPLLLMCKYLFDVRFELLREVAAESRRMDELESRFWDICHHARQFAIEQQQHGLEGPLSEWNALARHYPMIERIPLGQVVRRKLRALRTRVLGASPASESN
jgi:hypothetical protein